MAAPAATSLAPGLSRKVKKILEIKAEAPDLVVALATLSSFQTENTPAARRALRSTIEQRSLDINDTFLHTAEAVIAALDAAQSNLDGLSQSCSRVKQVLGSTKDLTSQLLGETERLQRELESVDRKSQLITDFLEHYQLSPDEVQALQSEDIGPEFFAALSRVRQIHDNCRALLRTNHQRAGLELMDMMAMYQETAYERLCRWVQGECRSIGESDAPEVGPVLQSAVRALHERPVLFKYCAEEVATARHTALFQRFITALTRGGPGGMPRPMEIHAHDPQRYVNDMLAWVHQSLAGEREFVAALFGEEGAAGTRQGEGPGSGGGAAAGGRQAATGAQDSMLGWHEGLASAEGMSTAALLDRIFESICRPLRVRIEQVLMTTPPLLLCFQLAQLHTFYLGLITRIIGQSAQLAQTLAACRDMSHRVFMEQIRSRGDKLLRNPPAPPKDLSAPPQLVDAVHGMLEVVRAHESALESSSGSSRAAQAEAQASSQAELEPVLAAMLNPVLDACERSAEALTPDAPSRVDEPGVGPGRIDPGARHVYLINCLSASATALGQHTSAAPQVQMLLGGIEGHVSALVGVEAGRILARCGLADLVARLKIYTQQGADAAGPGTGPGGAGPGPSSAGEPGAAQPASDPALSHARVVEALRAFFVLVSSPDALPEFPAVQAPRLRADVVGRVGQALAEAFEAVYTVLDDPTMGYTEQGGSASVKHTPAQVRTILGVL